MPSNAEVSKDFEHICRVLREQMRPIALCLLAGLLAAGIYLALAKKSYASRAVILIEQQEKKVLNIQNVTQEDLKAVDVMKTVEQSLLSESLMLRVIRSNHLAGDRRFLPARNKPYTDEEMIRTLSRTLSVKLRRGTRLVDLTVQSRSPELARQLAQSFVDEYLREGFDQRLSVSRIANEFLLKEAGRLKTKLEDSDRKLQDYREKNNAVSLIDKQNITVETLKELNLKVTEASARRVRAESDFAQFERLSGGNPRDLLAIPSVADSRSVQEAKSRVASQEAILAALKQRYRAEHPKYIQARSQLAQINADYDKTVVKAGESIQAAYEAALTNEKKLAEALRAQEKTSLDLNKIAIPYNVLVNDVAADREMYQSIVTRLKETDITKALGDNPVRVIESPRISDRPVRPKNALVLLLGAALGLCAGIGGILARDIFDASVHTADDAERRLGMPVLAAVPRAEKRGAHSPLPLVDEPYSHTAEAFHSLCTTVSLRDPGETRITLFTSACPLEGKTFCAVNHAVALTRHGRRTLIIDADLRRPSVAERLHAAPGSPGLADVFSRAASPEECLQESRIPGLTLLSAGRTGCVHPNELLVRENISRLLASAALKRFDCIIIDSAPILTVSDTLPLIGSAGLVCLVVRASATPAQAVERTARILAEAGANKAGIVLNGIEPSSQPSAYAYEYTAGRDAAKTVPA